MIKKSIESLPWVKSSHGCGQKRVLLSDNETATNLTQVAIISLKAGEEGKEHMHWKIEEGFYVLKGELILQADGTNHILHVGGLSASANGYHSCKHPTLILPF